MFDRLERAADRIQLALLLGMLLLSLWAWQQLPPGASVPVHFNARGEIDGWGSPALGFLGLPGVAALLWGLQGPISAMNRSMSDAADSARTIALYRIEMLSVTGLFAVIQVIVVATALSDWRPSAVHFLLPLFMVFVVVGRVVLKSIDPGILQFALSARAVRTLRWASVGPLVVVFALMAREAWGSEPAPNLMLAAIGALLMVTGNVMGKLRYQTRLGIRTRWTLASARVWDQTHRFGGKVMVLGGVVLLGMAAAPLPPIWHGPLVALVALLVRGASVLQSYRLWLRWRAENDGGQAGGQA